MHRVDAFPEHPGADAFAENPGNHADQRRVQGFQLFEPRTCRAPPRFSSLSSTMKSGWSARWSKELSISFRMARSGGNPARLSLAFLGADLLIDPFKDGEIERILVAEIVIDELLVDGPPAPQSHRRAPRPARFERTPAVRRSEVSAAWRRGPCAGSWFVLLVFQAFPTKQLTTRLAPCCIGSAAGVDRQGKPASEER